jgi:hypothetical protein
VTIRDAPNLLDMESTRLHQELRGSASMGLMACAIRGLSHQASCRSGDLEQPGIGYQNLSW